MAADHPQAPVFSFTFPSAIQSLSVPMKSYLASHKEYTAIISGALVFDSEDKLLILQRAAHDSMPNLWEVPGGSCDEDDETILHGVAREVWEESGLEINALGRIVGPNGGQLLFTKRRHLKVGKFTFEAEVKTTEGVKLDPNEHQNYLWVTEEECRAYEAKDGDSLIKFTFTTQAQEATVLEGFRMRKAAKADSL